MNTETKINATRAILDAVVDSVKVAGDHGAPGGILYAAMMAHGVTFSQYEAIMGALVKAGRLTRRGQLYFAA